MGGTLSKNKQSRLGSSNSLFDIVKFRNGFKRDKRRTHVKQSGLTLQECLLASPDGHSVGEFGGEEFNNGSDFLVRRQSPRASKLGFRVNSSHQNKSPNRVCPLMPSSHMESQRMGFLSSTNVEEESHTCFSAIDNPQRRSLKKHVSFRSPKEDDIHYIYSSPTEH
ncbi:hypothetical protein AMTR_s00090p00074480 [Amborella trichopoda]|uniref:Uncharacterized protein n=1 Tax=Amborella trichopoda TaxID=13333 RepID=W1P3U1_AMBTC|nr:hypothetical protein AMTR_s00090p00074480 [Amborella trichopoda]